MMAACGAAAAASVNNENILPGCCVVIPKERLMKRFLLMIALAAMSLAAADATGTWTGTLALQGSDDGQTRPAYLVLKQEGAKLTGSAGPSADQQHPIEEGKVEGDRITLQANNMKFDLKLNGDEITGEITRERDGQTQRATLKVKRQS